MTKKKIAILGGGLGSLTTALYLTEEPGWEDRYEITLHQIGWRLGGKGASSRNLNAGYGKRIEEHGLHIWFGFYDNGFRMFKDALRSLDELGAERPVKTHISFEQAFSPQSLVSFEQRMDDGRWEHWHVPFPMRGGEVGRWSQDIEPDDNGHLQVVDPSSVLLESIKMFLEMLSTISNKSGEELLTEQIRQYNHAAEPEPDSFLENLFEGLTGGLTSLFEKPLVDLLGLAMGTGFGRGVSLMVARSIKRVLDVQAKALEDEIGNNVAVRRQFVLADMGGRMIAGVLEDSLLVDGFEKVDHLDFREWLLLHGAHLATADSAPVRAIYDLVFGFIDGDTDLPKQQFAAGTAVRGTMRMLFTYRGALMYRMNGGMGDVIFTPLYGLLKHRGVKFEFFHKVEEITADPSGTNVEEIRITKQATVTDAQKARGGYWPFVEVAEQDCWPDRPNFDQLVEGDVLRGDPDGDGHPYDLESWYTDAPPVGSITLKRGTDFDEVVCGLSVGALPYVASDLIAKHSWWKTMVEGDPANKIAPVKTTPTLGVQLWLKKSAAELGWKIPTGVVEDAEAGTYVGLDPILGSYAQPLDTWADMTHLLPLEPWPETHQPGSVAYFCGPLNADDPAPFTDHGYPHRMRERTKAFAIKWFHEYGVHLWPTAGKQDGSFDPNELIDPAQRLDAGRWDAQWFRANIDPTERYVLSVPGSTQARVPGDACGFANLVLTGDWTLNDVLNAGCVEATVASGIQAANRYRAKKFPIAQGRDVAGAIAKRKG